MSIDGISQSYQGSPLDVVIKNNLTRKGENEEIGRVVGNQLSRLEDALMELYSMPEGGEVEDIAAFAKKYGLEKSITASSSTEVSGLRQAVEVLYRRALRTYESFMQLTRNAHETMMRAIQNLRIG